MNRGFKDSICNNLKIHKNMKCETTGMDLRGYASDVGIAPSNLFTGNGVSTSMDEMIASMKEGITVTEITGPHAGLNAMTGEFSLQSPRVGM